MGRGVGGGVRGVGDKRQRWRDRKRGKGWGWKEGWNEGGRDGRWEREGWR